MVIFKDRELLSGVVECNRCPVPTPHLPPVPDGTAEDNVRRRLLKLPGKAKPSKGAGAGRSGRHSGSRAPKRGHVAAKKSARGVGSATADAVSDGSGSGS